MLRIVPALLMSFALAACAQAGSLGSHLSFDHVPDILDDDSVSFVVDRDGDLSLSTGDIVSGFLRIGTTSANGILAPDDQLIGVYSFEVASSVGNAGPDPTVLLTARGVDPLDGTGLSIDEILAGAGIVAPQFGVDATIAVLTSDNNPVDITTVPLAGAIAALSSYELGAILGYGTADDYLEVRSFSDVNDNGLLDFAELPAGPNFFAAETGGMSVLHHTLGPSTVFIPVASLHTDNVTQTLHDVAITGTLFGARPSTPAGYTITDSTFLTVNAVPEPSSLAMWGLLLGAAVGIKRRRKGTNV